MYLLNYEEYCQINLECAELLSKCELPELEKLNLFHCSIGDLEIELICNGKWPKLKQANFSTVLFKLGCNNIKSNGFMCIGNAKWS